MAHVALRVLWLLSVLSSCPRLSTAQQTGSSPNCDRDYSVLCPAGWARRGDGCVAPSNHTTTCAVFVSIPLSDVAAKQKWEQSCGAVWACKGGTTEAQLRPVIETPETGARILGIGWALFVIIILSIMGLLISILGCATKNPSAVFAAVVVVIAVVVAVLYSVPKISADEKQREEEERANQKTDTLGVWRVVIGVLLSLGGLGGLAGLFVNNVIELQNACALDGYIRKQNGILVKAL